MDPVPVEPSPKLQLKVYGNVPPVATAVNETGVLINGLEGRKVKLTDNGATVRTVTVAELVAIWEGVDESVAVSLTVNDCALVKV